MIKGIQDGVWESGMGGIRTCMRAHTPTHAHIPNPEVPRSPDGGVGLGSMEVHSWTSSPAFRGWIWLGVAPPPYYWQPPQGCHAQPRP